MYEGAGTRNRVNKQIGGGGGRDAIRPLNHKIVYPDNDTNEWSYRSIVPSGHFLLFTTVKTRLGLIEV